MKNKKIGILTFHQSRNYGAVLQGYALQQKLSETFESVEIIDYQNPEIAKVVKLWDKKQGGLKAFLKALLGFVFRFRKKMAFDKYLKKYINLSEKVSNENISDITSKYDVLITGSDQVWNTGITGKDAAFFLDFTAPHQKRVSYAASFGDKHIEIDESFKNMLKNFDLITLREKVMLDDVQNISEKPVHICCDPTLLISSSEWKNHASKKLKNEPYVFLFVIDESPELLQYAKKVAEEKNLPLISNKNDISFFASPLPNDFLSWLLNAEYVVTNSFHGTVFSLLFNKKFVSHTLNSSGETKKRIVELLKTVNLEHRTTSNNSLNIDLSEDWGYVDRQIDNIRHASWKVMSEWFKYNCGGN